MELRGNNVSYAPGGVDQIGSTLHWGVNGNQNKFMKTHKDYKHTESLHNDFHIYGLYWDDKKLYTYIDT